MSYSIKLIPPGTLVSNRTIILSTLIRETSDGLYPVYIAVAHSSQEYHPYVVWYVSERPEGYHAESGEYFHDAKDAIINWQEKGGK
jgi:hypothetical protein